ncbi:MAG: AAA family ATPase [Halanaerobiales bacterium]|nr:AAA family ATPase [Halanaerobiales bacterium]
MLTKLKLCNFRCFARHTIPLKENTIIVGRNNAGKSTIVEASNFVHLKKKEKLLMQVEKELNPVIRGWRIYFKISNSTKKFQKWQRRL